MKIEDLSDDAKSKALSGCATAIAALAMTPFSIAFNGWILKVMWGWFVVTTFSAPALTVAAAVGLSCIFSLLSHRYQHKSASAEKITITLLVAHSFMGPLLALGVAYIVHLFV